MKYKISDEGLDALIKTFEGVRLKPYLCEAGVPTIGWGHAILPGEHFTEITIEFARDLLKKDLVKFEDAVNSLVKVPIDQYQFDAMVSLCYNIGIDAFKNSTLLKKLNSYENKQN